MPVTCPSFKAAFKANMAALGLPAPDSLFSTYTTAVTNVSAMLNALSKLGKGATVAELIGATTALEFLGAVAGLGAAAYTGAVIGSLIVAANASAVCTNTAVAVSQWGGANGVHIPASMLAFIQRNPEVLDASSPRAASFAFRNRIA